MATTPSKRDIRLAVRRLCQAVSPAAAQAASAAVMQRIERAAEWTGCLNVLLYCSLPDELPTRMMLDAWSRHKRLYLPRVAGDEIEVVRYDPDDPGSLVRGAFGIMEPAGPAIPEPKIDLAIIPGTAFDRGCNRLGRGRGYYDRWLSRHRAATCVGVGYDFQLLANGVIPVEEHDRPMDCVVTPAETIYNRK